MSLPPSDRITPVQSMGDRKSCQREEVLFETRMCQHFLHSSAFMSTALSFGEPVRQRDSQDQGFHTSAVYCSRRTCHEQAAKEHMSCPESAVHKRALVMFLALARTQPLNTSPKHAPAVQRVKATSCLRLAPVSPPSLCIRAEKRLFCCRGRERAGGGPRER